MDEDRLVRAVQSGDHEAVRLLLAAGVRAGARTASGEPVIVAAARGGRHQIVSDLLAAGADPLDLAHAVSDRGRRKDTWEKLGSLSAVLTFTSSVMIAGIGWYFTKSYNDRQVEAQQSQNRQQNRLIEMQTIERLIPHLTKDEESKRAALIAINELASPALAIQIGEAFGGTGAVAALGSIASGGGASASQAVSGLATIASRGTPEEASAVQTVLGRVFASARDSVVTVVVDERRCSGFVVAGPSTTVLTADYCVPANAKSAAIEVNGRKFAASVLSRNASGGAVALRAPGVTVPGLILATTMPQIGTPVIGIAASMPFTDRTGTAKAFPGRTTGVDVDITASTSGLEEFGIRGRVDGLLEVTFDKADERGGSAGGPILDAAGSVVCMVYLGTQTKDNCVPAARLRSAAGGG